MRACGLTLAHGQHLASRSQGHVSVCIPDKMIIRGLPYMVKQRFKVGDIVKVTHYTPVRYPPGVKDELGTEPLFRRIVGRRYRIMGFDEHGYIELHPTRRDSIWIKSDDVKLAPGKKKRSG